jgi:glycosyltransferase involved in cell wall biosynthesis
MNIAYDHQFFSMFGYSGITRYFFEIISRIAYEQGVSVSLFMGWHKNKFSFNKHRRAFGLFFGPLRPALPKTTRIFNIFNDALFPPFFSLTGADIYHQTYYRYFLPRFKGRRICTVHDMTYELFPELYWGNDPSIVDKRTSIDRADALIAVSQSTKNDLVRLWNIDPARIKVIYHANSLTATPMPTPPIDRPYILYVGQRIAHKNFSRLLLAYCRSPRINREYGLVCFGGNAPTHEELSLLSQHGCEGKMIRLTGDDSLLATCYAHAAVLVYPSKYEGFGLPLVEAMHFGCPVLASNISSLPEVGADAGLYFDPSDTSELIHKLECVLSDSKLRESMATKGRIREAGFSWDLAARQTLELYKRVA